MRKLFIFAVALAAMFACTSKQDQFNEEVKAIMERNNNVGLALVAVNNGQVVLNETYGYKNLDTKEPIAKDDIFRIASISKSFCATAVMQLVEQGKLDLQQDVSELVGFQVRNPKFPEKVITVEMLLSHTSSMSDANGYFSFDSLSEKSWNNYEPGSKYQYCNLGYNTLGAIIEKVSGERFDEYVYNHVLAPLGVYANHNVHSLDSTRFVGIYTLDKSTGEYTASVAYPSIEDGLANYKEVYSAPIFSPTGGLKISAKDLARVMMMHMNGGTLDGVKIISSESSALMQSEITTTNYEGERYGMALLRTNDMVEGQRLIGHDGLALGAHTAMFWHPEKKFGMVIMTNGCNSVTDKVFPNIVRETAACLFKNFAE